jgi:hypothetical protein
MQQMSPTFWTAAVPQPASGHRPSQVRLRPAGHDQAHRRTGAIVLRRMLLPMHARDRRAMGWKRLMATRPSGEHHRLWLYAQGHGGPSRRVAGKCRKTTDGRGVIRGHVVSARGGRRWSPRIIQRATTWTSHGVFSPQPQAHGQSMSQGAGDRRKGGAGRTTKHGRGGRLWPAAERRSDHVGLPCRSCTGSRHDEAMYGTA